MVKAMLRSSRRRARDREEVQAPEPSEKGVPAALLPPLEITPGTPVEDAPSRPAPPDTSPRVPVGTVIYAEVDVPNVAVGATLDFSAVLRTDQNARPVAFLVANILQVDIVARNLQATDSVVFKMYRRARRREPDDLLARFSGTSQVTGMWRSGFVDQQIHYMDLDKSSTGTRDGTTSVYFRVENSSGNSGGTTFLVHLIAKVVAI